MIRNEQEYNITRRLMKLFQYGAEGLRNSRVPIDIDPILHLAQLEAMVHQVETFQKEIALYENNVYLHSFVAWLVYGYHLHKGPKAEEDKNASQSLGISEA